MSAPSVGRLAAAAFSIVVCLSVVAPLFVGPAGALVQGEPDVSLTVADNRVSAGETTTLEVAAVNRGDLDRGSSVGNVEAERRVTTARGVTLSPEGDGPITVRTNEVALGSLSDGAAATAGFEIVVDEDADPGTYDIDVEVEYRYTSSVGEGAVPGHSERRVSRERTVSVVVDEEARFEVVDVDARSPGESGTFAVDVENTGEATANDAVVSLSSLSGDVQFGASGGGSQQSQAGQGTQQAQQQGQQTQQATQGGDRQGARTFVREWAPGERRTLLFQGSVDEDAPLEEVPASLSVEYTDENGVEFDSESTFGIRPEGEQTFAFDPGESSLRVGQEGTVRGTFVNEGPGEARNVVVTLEPPGRNVEVIEPELALGDLAAGEEVDVAFDVEVSSSGRSGDRQFGLTTEYETAGGDDRTADAIRFRRPVEPRRDVFDVEATERTVTAGGSGRLVLSVTNNQEETVTDVSAKLFASQPLSTADDEAFIDELEPGETAEIPFEVSASGSAMTKDYPVSVDFQYVDESGETRLTDSYRVPVTVEEDDGGFFGLFGLFGVAGTAGAALLVPALYRRR